MEKNSEKRILIVDDVARNIQILANILSGNGYQIAYAQNGRQAIKIAMSQDFDLILLDIMMPEMDGYEVCSLLKKEEKTASAPIIFLTAKADMESIVKGFEIGGQDYITKPFNSAELLARVKTQIQLKTQKEQLKQSNVILEKKVEERTKELQEANKILEKLDKTKGDFLSIISHELRTPLNGIVGLTNLLSTTSLDSSQNEYIEHLTEVSQRLVRFSDMALLITSLKIEEYKPDFLSVSINHIVNSAIKEFNRLHENNKIIVKLSTDESKPLILADSEMIKQVFILIIENALKYAGNSKPLSVEINSDSELVMVKFKDEGPGFSEVALTNIFELFGAGDILHIEGSGLSLAAVKLIVDMHNGKVEAKNNEDEGAELLFKFSRFTD